MRILLFTLLKYSNLLILKLGYEALVPLDDENMMLNSYQGMDIMYQKFNLKTHTQSVTLKSNVMMTVMVCLMCLCIDIYVNQ